MSARLDTHEHSRHQWLIGAIAPDFDLLDAWSLPVMSESGDIAELVAVFSSLDLTGSSPSPASRVLFGARSLLGRLFGWDDDINVLPIPGCEETSLRERLPADVAPATANTAGSTSFRPVYQTANEWALELSNSTVHAALHLGWVPRGQASFGGQLGVYVKPRGRLGRPYMTAIAPFRHHIVYPQLMKRIDHAWRTRPNDLPAR